MLILLFLFSSLPGFFVLPADSLRDKEILWPIDCESNDCISQTEVERILGQPARVTENTTEERGPVLRHQCVFMATVEDTKTRKRGNLHYLFEEYKDPGSAHNAFVDIVSSNAGMPGQQKLDGLGNEGWFHSDDNNFHMIIFRKENKMVRIKVNKVTSMTSSLELKKVAREMASRI